MYEGLWVGKDGNVEECLQALSMLNVLYDYVLPSRTTCLAEKMLLPRRYRNPKRQIYKYFILAHRQVVVRHFTLYTSLKRKRDTLDWVSHVTENILDLFASEIFSSCLLSGVVLAVVLNFFVSLFIVACRMNNNVFLQNVQIILEFPL